MIKMGRVAAYDFKVFLPVLCILCVGLAAACKFGDRQSSTSSGEGPKLQLGG